MINDLPKKRAKNVKVAPITTAGLGKDIKDALKTWHYNRKVDKLFDRNAEFLKGKRDAEKRR